MKKIAIVGHGFVGKAVEFAFKRDLVDITLVDPKYGNTLDDITDCDYAFVCVPTPMNEDGSVDASILRDAVHSLIEKTQAIIVIKSTVTPDHLVDLDKSRIVYNPEFLTEANACLDFINADFHILGGEQNQCYNVEYLYRSCTKVKWGCSFYRMSIVEASLVKYGINSFLATKVTFFNQLKDLCEKWGADYDVVSNSVGSDSRISKGHTRVPGPDGRRGFGGACLPKDTSALYNFSEGEFNLLQSVLTINNDYRIMYELSDREKQMKINFGDD